MNVHTVLGLQSFPREQNNKRQVRHVGRYNKELIENSFVKFFQHGGCDVYCKRRVVRPNSTTDIGYRIIHLLVHQMTQFLGVNMKKLNLYRRSKEKAAKY